MAKTTKTTEPETTETTPTPTPLEQATAAVERIRAYGDVRGWRTNLTPTEAEALSEAEDDDDEDAVAVTEAAADLDRRESKYQETWAAQQREILAAQEAQAEAEAEGA